MVRDSHHGRYTTRHVVHHDIRAFVCPPYDEQFVIYITLYTLACVLQCLIRDSFRANRQRDLRCHQSRHQSPRASPIWCSSRPIWWWVRDSHHSRYNDEFVTHITAAMMMSSCDEFVTHTWWWVRDSYHGKYTTRAMMSIMTPESSCVPPPLYDTITSFHPSPILSRDSQVIYGVALLSRID